MRSLIVGLSLLFGVANAADRSAAYNVICKPMPFESDRQNCLLKVKRFDYFDNRGLAICAALPFSTGQVSCMEIIGNKTYETYEMDSCVNQTFDSKKVECLEQNGTVYNPNKPTCVPRDEVVIELSNTLQEMRTGRLKNADNRISALLNRFNQCN